jgi:hypothetical protein
MQKEDCKRALIIIVLCFCAQIVFAQDTVNTETQPPAITLDTIEVTAEKEKIIRINPDAVSVVSISPKLIEKLPNFGEVDIMRAFQLLPGISGSNEASAGLYVRGGTPDQNLILFDGMTLYHVDHFYGFFSAFNANSVDDVALHKGGFPAEFGGRTSSVLDIKGKPANMHEFNFGAGLSLLSANAFAEIPIVKEKLSVQASARRSYTDLLKTPLYNKISNMYNEAEEGASIKGEGKSGKQSLTFEPAFYFYDLNTKLSFKPNNKDLFTISFYNGKDNLDNSRDLSKGSDNTVIISDVLEWGNVGVSTGWQSRWMENIQSDLSLSYSNYFSLSDNSMSLDTAGASSSIGLFNSYEDNNVKDYSMRLGGIWHVSEKNTLKSGVQITHNDISYQYTQIYPHYDTLGISRYDTLEILNRQDKGSQYAVYLLDEHTFFNKLKINGGLRGTRYNVTDKLYLEPRLSAIQRLPYKLKLKGAVGLYNQYISRTIREDVRAGSRDFWILSDDTNVPVSSAIHYIAGIDWALQGYGRILGIYHALYGQQGKC